MRSLLLVFALCTGFSVHSQFRIGYHFSDIAVFQYNGEAGYRFGRHSLSLVGGRNYNNHSEELSSTPGDPRIRGFNLGLRHQWYVFNRISVQHGPTFSYFDVEAVTIGWHHIVENGLTYTMYGPHYQRVDFNRWAYDMQIMYDWRIMPWMILQIGAGVRLRAIVGDKLDDAFEDWLLKPVYFGSGFIPRGSIRLTFEFGANDRQK